MAQKTLIQLVDDIDGTPIEDGGGRTVTFTLKGVTYEIDLCDAHIEELTKSFSPYVSAGRRAGRKSTTSTSSAKSDPAELKKIREWARANGHDVSDRGRVSATVRDAYNAAH
ncbi:Lsr2 family protein [Frigoribacterium sp. CFBP 13712]|uniref:histone-like nucleoid-structuring protein Lsr2 n=1 Tax=Frigoribacterium sp. CFBP 13712 TaxID=2775309 RepID=UPI00177D127D|nr:Lsr2 family protein [Frigoribacterium sp. CFBP 13712]MBD8704922.1 Lsr2 family protein [Frigoribacterium sp. CFBP 13712]